MAENDDLLAIYKRQSDSLEKHTYFLLTAAGAGIGFAFQKTEGVDFSWWLLPVASATLCWGLSFYFGCLCIDKVQTSTTLNYESLLVQQGRNPRISPAILNVQMKKIAIEKVDESFEDAVNLASMYARRQFYLLIGGAAFLVLWRIAEMVHLHYSGVAYAFK